MFKGRCILEFVDIRTGATRRIEKENLITDRACELMLIGNQSSSPSVGVTGQLGGAATGLRIGISQHTGVPDPTVVSKNSLSGSRWEAQRTAVQEFFGEDPPYIQHQTQLGNPGLGNARTFQTAYTGDNGTSLYSYLLLDDPCTQGDFEVLNLFYQFISAPQSSGQWSDLRSDYLSHRIFIALFGPNNSAEPNMMFAFGLSWQQLPNQSTHPYQTLQRASALTGTVPATNTVLHTNAYFNKRTRHILTLTQRVGIIYNTILAGTLSYFTAADQVGGHAITSRLKFSNRGPRQGLFVLTNSSSGPFFNSLTAGVSAGRPVFNDAWNQPYPQMYEVQVATGGMRGTATYRFRYRNFIRFNSNTFQNLPEACLFVSPTDRTIAGGHGLDNLRTGYDFVRYSDTQVVFWDATGITLVNVANGEYRTWDSLSTPALPVTNIGQVECNGQVVNAWDNASSTKIIIACRDTGLWEIDVVANTVTQHIATACYGADYGIGGKVYAVVNGRLTSSDDYTATLSLNYIGITDGNWSNVSYLKADPETAGNRLAFVRVDNSQVVWLDDGMGGAATNGPTIGTHIVGKPRQFDVSDVGGIWAGVGGNTATTSRVRHYTFNAATASADRGGNSVVSFIGDLLYVSLNSPATFRLFNSAGTVVHEWTMRSYSGGNQRGGFLGNTLGGTSNIVFYQYLGNGIALCRGQAENVNYAPWVLYAQFEGIDSLLWRQYGWNGSAWILDNANARTTHSTTEDLINGVTVSFTTTGAAGDYVANERFSQGYCWGVLKDTATELTVDYYFYSRACRFDEPFPGSLTVPATAPYTVSYPATVDPNWRLALNNVVNHFSINLDGTPVATILLSGTPGPNEVVVGQQQMTFDAADAGKTITGSYSWIGM